MRSVKLLRALALVCFMAGTPVRANDPSPLPFVEGSWTIVLLPDTQRYSQNFPDTFRNQTRWIRENKERRRIAFVLHEGDIVNRAMMPEWENARSAMSILDGHVPYVLAAGNHDYTGVMERATSMSNFFPVEKFRQQATFGGTFETNRIENSYHLFAAGGVDWVVIALETAPRDAAVHWADQVLKRYPNRKGIIVTHAYLYNDNTRYDYKTRPDQLWSPHPRGVHRDGINDGEELWEKLVASNRTMAFVFCGHVLGDGAGRLTSRGTKGNLVHQILLNCQSYPGGG